MWACFQSVPVEAEPPWAISTPSYIAASSKALGTVVCYLTDWASVSDSGMSGHPSTE